MQCIALHPVDPGNPLISLYNYTGQGSSPANAALGVITTPSSPCTTQVPAHNGNIIFSKCAIFYTIVHNVRQILQQKKIILQLIT